MIKFNPKDHSYTVNDTEILTSVTTLIGAFKEPFDADAIALKSSNGKGKWKGIPPEKIKEIWEKEKNRACDLGNWYHDQREMDVRGCDTLERYGKILPVYRPVEIAGIKYATAQRLKEGIYPEHLAYLKSANISGQIDLLEIADGHVHITDYKSNKEIKMKSYVNWEGLSKKMAHPVSHLDDCNFNHYALQLSMYMYMVLKHNPKLKPGKMIIQHVKFEEAGEDEFGYPILKLEDGNPIIKEIDYIDVPYLKEEVFNILLWFKGKGFKL